MHPLRRKRGRVVNTRAPIWEPLFELAPEHIGDFMWMCEVELEDATRIHCYKHYETRRSIHLDHGGRAFVFIWDETRSMDESAVACSDPPLLPDSPTLPKVSTSLPQAEFNAMRERAEAEGRPLSDVAREALRRCMDTDS